ncbi:response regulator transcription factor [Bacillus kwashiorkori]|uniref:response regulator transcription factor n=1 Tax=Bacillus kwashiorkori TaxID=1522318 RepID=UPI00078220F1|nr:response regulator transcription factor [Bacillus kwashiorkori]
MSKKILVVDDEQSIVTLLDYNLRQAGFQVITAYDGQAGLQIALSENPDFIVLDLMLPFKDGIDVCKELRNKQVTTPILMLTAKDDEIDKVLGLELGADDYMTKPFSPREVVARIKAILRRTQEYNEVNVDKSDFDQDSEESLKKIQVSALTIFPESYEAYFDGTQLNFTPKEFELLLYLVQNKGKVLSREVLLNAVWNYDFVGDTRIVDVHISHLREKIESNSKKPQFIKTIRGLGYKFEVPKE